MMSLFSLQLIIAALLSLQCGYEASAQMDSTQLDNSLQPNVVHAAVPKRRTIKKFLRIQKQLPKTVRHVAGTTLELECLGFGKPAPTVEWLRNGEPIEDYREESNDIYTTHPSSVGRLASKLFVTRTTDGDEFTCLAVNGFKEVSSSTTVYKVGDEEDDLFLNKLLYKPSKPTITAYFLEVFQDIGTQIILPCEVFSTTKSQVFWHTGNNNLIYENSRMQVLPSGDLLINTITWDDMGNFTCTAKNMYGKDIVTTFLYPMVPQV